MKQAVISKHRSLLSSGVFLHDNAHHHKARATDQQITNLRLDGLSRPAFSPNITSSDYHGCEPLKDLLVDSGRTMR